MISLENISIDYKFTAAFGIVALLLSLIIGIFSGIGFEVIALRLLIVFPVFSLIGYGVIFVSKKYVPELYDKFANLQNEEDRNNIDENSDAAQYSGPSGSSDDNASDGLDDTDEDSARLEEDESFTEITPDQYKRVDLTDELNSETETFVRGKLGKHVIEREKFVKYEPKLMAEAVRTMMSKDDD